MIYNILSFYLEKIFRQFDTIEDKLPKQKVIARGALNII